jgi:hypothetical protein
MKGVFNKKGSGQFEMVIAFVFFMGFVLFLFLFLKPGDTTILSGAVISELHDSFEEEAHTNLSNVFLKSNYTGGGDCFRINLTNNLFKYSVNDGDSYVALLDGSEVDSGLEGEDLNIDNESIFFRVLISPEFEDGVLSGCEELFNFELGSIVERRVISYNSLEQMKIEYDTDYAGLRNSLNVPPIYDFAIIPESFPSLEMMPRSGIPDAVEVMARDYLFEVIRSDGTFSNERINFRIW